MEGPAFSTRAESHMHRLWGADLVGMTLLPEAKLAREAEIPYAAVCLVTDYDSWRPPAQDSGLDADGLLQEIIGNLKQATSSATALLRRTISMAADRREELADAPATRALDLGIWSDRRRIAEAEVRRLWPLWSRHFEPEMGEVSPATAEASRVD
jgi:5'-methylthioadenosine phosphorylase